MIVEHINKNLFEHYNENSSLLNIIIHGCNAQGKMNSGFAKELRSRYPGAYDEYMHEYNNNGLVLGTTIYYPASENLIIANSITQQYYGYDGNKFVSYDAIDTITKDLNIFIKTTEIETSLHFPKIGSDLGGGTWEVIREIIDHNVVDAHKHLYILK